MDGHLFLMNEVPLYDSKYIKTADGALEQERLGAERDGAAQHMHVAVCVLCKATVYTFLCSPPPSLDI